MCRLIIDNRLKPLKSTNNMKYFVLWVIALIMYFICMPVWLFTWNWNPEKNGWSSIVDGLYDMFGIN
jgi:hypothetical protein